MSQLEEQFCARIVERYCLNKRGTSRDTWHIVLEAEKELPLFQPGDCIGVYPKNSHEDSSHLRPRLYSIASGPSAGRKCIELIIARVLYERDGVLHRGLCSNYLIEGAPLQESTLSCFYQPTRHFIFPNEVPIIMVGAGTGIAPFRAYMQEVECRAATPKKCWLFFGQRKSSEDFFYEEFWKRQIGQERLRLHVAFSCDQEHKVYVQHRMWQEREEVWQWLQQGAHLLVCGHAQKMAKDVESCLLDIAKDEGGMKQSQAEEWLLCMRKSKRYLKDVY